jgi:hypothetical protein
LSIFNSQDFIDYNDIATNNNKLIDKIIKTVDPGKTKIFGNTDFNTQIMLSNSGALKEAEDISKYHNVTIINSTDCVDKLKIFYNINKDLLIVKTEDSRFNTNNLMATEINIDFYNLNTRELLNKTLCNTDKKEIKLPIQLTAVEASKYNKLKESGIDMFSSANIAFRTNCFSYVDPDIEYDTTLNYRVDTYLKYRTDCVKQGCTYKEISSDGYIICTCNDEGGNSLNVTESTDTNDDYKNNLLECSGKIQVLADGRINSGLLIACCLISFQIILTALLMFIRRNKKPILDKIIKQDCLTFDRKVHNLGEYFLGKATQAEVKTDKPNQDIIADPGADVNTTRQLKDEIDTPKQNFAGVKIEPFTPLTSDRLVLRENVMAVHPLDNLEGNTSQINNSKVYNNFCEVTNKENNQNEVNNDIVITKQTTDAELVANVCVKITMKDFEALTLQERFIYDSRSFVRYLLDNLVRNNLLISIFFKHSLAEPIYIRVAKLTLSFTLLFGTNAILFVDSYIEQRAFNPNEVFSL